MSSTIFQTRKQFVDQVFIQRDKDKSTVFEAVMSVIEQFDIDIETAARFIKQSHNLRSALEEDAVALKMCKK